MAEFYRNHPELAEANRLAAERTAALPLVTRSLIEELEKWLPAPTVADRLSEGQRVVNAEIQFARQLIQRAREILT